MRIRFRLSIRARMSSVSSTSCFTAVLIVDSDEAMKSASRPGSVMLIASVCRSSDSSGDSETTCWKFVLMLRAQRVDLEAVRVVGVFGGGADPGAQVRLRRDDLVERQPRQPLDDQPQAAVRQLEHLVDVRRGADRIQIVLQRLLDRRVALGEDRDQLAVGDRVVDQADRALAGHGERHERIRKQHRVAKRQDRQLGRNRERPIAGRDVLGLEVLELIAHGDPFHSDADCARSRNPKRDAKF